MFCNSCNKKISEGANFCKYCGTKIVLESDLFESASTGEVLDDDTNNVDSKENLGITIIDPPQPLYPEEQGSFIKKAAVVTGYTGIFALSWVYQIAYLITMAITAISIFSAAISLFSSGSWAWGLVVLFIGLPVGISLTSYFFPIVAALYLVSFVLWIGAKVFGSTSSFDDIHSTVSTLFWIALFGFLAWAISKGLWDWIKSEKVKQFFTQNWVLILAGIGIIFIIINEL